MGINQSAKITPAVTIIAPITIAHVYFIGLNFAGDILSAHANSFTLRDSDIQVYIPKFYLCEFKKTKGRPCIPVSNCRHFLPNNLNKINLSDKYCSHNKYWYDFAEIQ